MIGTGGLRVLGIKIFRSRYLTGIVPTTTAARVYSASTREAYPLRRLPRRLDTSGPT
jgi:hypothetical protein